MDTAVCISLSQRRISRAMNDGSPLEEESEEEAAAAGVLEVADVVQEWWSGGGAEVVCRRVEELEARMANVQKIVEIMEVTVQYAKKSQCAVDDAVALVAQVGHAGRRRRSCYRQRFREGDVADILDAADRKVAGGGARLEQVIWMVWVAARQRWGESRVSREWMERVVKEMWWRCGWKVFVDGGGGLHWRLTGEMPEYLGRVPLAEWVMRVGEWIAYAVKVAGGAADEVGGGCQQAL